MALSALKTHLDGCEVLTVDAHYDPVRVRFLVATGINKKNQYTGLPVVLWVAGVRKSCHAFL